MLELVLGYGSASVRLLRLAFNGNIGSGTGKDE
jgi:hypothetical protein